MYLITGNIDKDIRSKIPKLSSEEAVQKSVDYLQNGTNYVLVSGNTTTNLYVFIDPTDSKAKLVYHITYIVQSSNKPSWCNVFAIVNADNGHIIHIVKQQITYKLSADGGNIKTGRYRYGQGRLEASMLDVEKDGVFCVMKNNRVSVYKFFLDQRVIDYFNMTNKTISPSVCFVSPYKEHCDINSPTDSTQFSYSQVTFYDTT